MKRWHHGQGGCRLGGMTHPPFPSSRSRVGGPCGSESPSSPPLLSRMSGVATRTAGSTGSEARAAWQQAVSMGGEVQQHWPCMAVWESSIIVWMHRPCVRLHITDAVIVS